MSAVADDRDIDPPSTSSDEVARLMETINAYKADNEKLRAENAALKRGSDRLQPLKSLLPGHVSYETARRACETGKLAASMPEGRWMATEAAVAAWLEATGRL
jgi:hypothetical protein